MGLFNLRKDSNGLEILELKNGQTLIGFHSKESCGGDCPIHFPSNHRMSKWDLVWRQDTFIFERICPKHGVGHPDPQSMQFVSKNKGSDFALSLGIHGCCGCCAGAEDK